LSALAGRLVRWLRGLPYRATLALLWPVNALLAGIRAGAFTPGAVLHISYLGHVPFHTVEALRADGVRADYLAVGDSATWGRSDFRITSSRWPFVVALREFWMLWAIVARYEIVHSHFMVTMSRTGWELPLLKRMGRKLVVHYRGCEIRDRALNRSLHPAVNICDECDYQPYPCESALNRARRTLAERYGDAFLVTTPDLKDFVPQAVHVRFLTPPGVSESRPAPRAGRPLKIVHATNHPGIEGTRHIVAAVEALKARGHAINLILLRGERHERVLAELADADLSIGKMKMGYYANAQVESLAAGVPAVTFVRPEFIAPEILDSGLILTTLETLEATLEHLLTHPELLDAKRARARQSVRQLHDNHAIAQQLASIYSAITTRRQ
jgi:glycosyltransferase involved in cell wall biosynthesis